MVSIEALRFPVGIGFGFEHDDHGPNHPTDPGESDDGGSEPDKDIGTAFLSHVPEGIEEGEDTQCQKANHGLFEATGALPWVGISQCKAKDQSPVGPREQGSDNKADGGIDRPLEIEPMIGGFQHDQGGCKGTDAQGR